MPRENNLTAAELIAQRTADPVWVARRAARGARPRTMSVKNNRASSCLPKNRWLTI